MSSKKLIRLFVATCIGLITGYVSWSIRSLTFGATSGDFVQILIPAQALLQGQNPFTDLNMGTGFVHYPFTAAFLGLPFLPIPELLGASIMLGCSSAWLAYRLLATGNWWRLLLFVSFPYLYTLVFVQFTPLITALALSGAAPLALLIKPQNALPLVLTYWGQRGAFMVAALWLIASLILLPSWPYWWLKQLGQYQGQIALFSAPWGYFLIFSLYYWRTRPARLLFLTACCPQRSYYDVIALWLIPQTPLSQLFLTVISWLPIFMPQYPLLILSCYLPALLILLYEHR